MISSLGDQSVNKKALTAKEWRIYIYSVVNKYKKNKTSSYLVLSKYK